MHTCSNGGVYLVVAMIGSPSSKLVSLAHKVISGPCIQVTGSINRIAGKMSMSGKGNLTLAFATVTECRTIEREVWQNKVDVLLSLSGRVYIGVQGVHLE
jgi:hypothetical protein